MDIRDVLTNHPEHADVQDFIDRLPERERPHLETHLPKDKHSALRVLDDLMHQTAGATVLKEMYAVLDDTGSVRVAYWTRLSEWDGKRAYDLCKQGDHTTVLTYWGQIAHSVYQ